MNNHLSISEAYCNLNKVIEFLKNENIPTELIESVEIARNSLLAIEMMGIISSSENHNKNSLSPQSI